MSISPSQKCNMAQNLSAERAIASRCHPFCRSVIRRPQMVENTLRQSLSPCEVAP